MVNDEFKVYQQKINETTDFSKVGKPTKQKIIPFKKVYEDGVIIMFAIKGPSAAVEKRFAGYPIGDGCVLKVSIATDPTPLDKALLLDQAKTPKGKEKKADKSPAAQSASSPALSPAADSAQGADQTGSSISDEDIDQVLADG
jgi:hypothetical protein